MAEHDIPIPSPIPSPSAQTPSLPERINISTRSIHTQLNRLILARLPLALPPHASNPSTYITGLLHIAPIYSTFESLWQDILSTPHLPSTLKPSFSFSLDACDPDHPLLDSTIPLILPNIDRPIPLHAPKVCSRTHSLLAHLRLPGLLRAGRLRADIRVLTRAPDHKISTQLEDVAADGELAAFLAHTRRSVEANPHVLLAYAWVLYMALFSGGRYLRASLQAAGGLPEEFWSRDPSPVRPYSSHQSLSASKSSSSPADDPRARSPSPSQPALQFFNFPGAHDGEDLKTLFKTRFLEVEALLTEPEKVDIVTEAGVIFSFMVGLVGELDAVMGSSNDVETRGGHGKEEDRGRPGKGKLGKEREERKSGNEIADASLKASKQPPLLDGWLNDEIARRLYGLTHIGDYEKTSARKRVVGLKILVSTLALLTVFLAWFYTL